MIERMGNQEEESPNRVSEGATKDGPPRSPTKNPKPKPRKQTQFGKADPIRDISIFAGILAFLFFLSWIFADVGDPDGDSLANKANLLNTAKKSIGNMQHSVREQMERDTRPKVKDCRVFLSQTSIPMEGFGLFAGQNYTAGDPIFVPGTIAQSPSLISVFSSHMEQTVFLPFFALLLNHHPSQTNVRVDRLQKLFLDSNTMGAGLPKLVASRDIAEGEELLLPWDLHPARFIEIEGFSDKIPQTHHYEDARKIIEESRIILQATGKKVPAKRKSDLALALKAIQSAVARYDKVVAGILPTIPSVLEKYAKDVESGKSLAEWSVNSRSRTSLAWDGYCLDDTVQVKGDSLYTTERSIEANQTFYTLPLFVHLNRYQSTCQQSEETCSPGSKEMDVCFGQFGSPVSLCPLSPAPVRVVDIYSEDSREQINSRFDWGNRNANNRKRGLFSPQMLLSKVSFIVSNACPNIVHDLFIL